MDMNTALPGGDDSTPGPGLISALRTERVERARLEKELRATRSEAARYRVELKELKATRPTIAVLNWRPSPDPRADGQLGFGDVQLGGLVVLDVRLIRENGAFILSWPRRQPAGSDRLHPILRLEPNLEARALAAVLAHTFPETTVELP